MISFKNFTSSRKATKTPQQALDTLNSIRPHDSQIQNIVPMHPNIETIGHAVNSVPSKSLVKGRWQKIDLDKTYSQQKHVDRAVLVSRIEKPQKRSAPVLAVHHKETGTNHLRNGNHDASEAILSGRKSMWARVVDV